MKKTLLLSCAFIVLATVAAPTGARAQSSGGKNCHMEQQCRWENFKKICTYVKVCR
jgi:hypothetical protein